MFVDAREGSRNRLEAKAKAARVDVGIDVGVDVVVVGGDGGVGCGSVRGVVVVGDVGGSGVSLGGVSGTVPPDPYPRRAVNLQPDQPSPPRAALNLDRRA